MMNREETINKIMEEYSKYDIDKSKVEFMYDSAIRIGIDYELIYPGMKLMINNTLGIDNTDVIREVGEGFKDFAVNDTRKSNPTVSDKVIAKNIEEELATGFDWKALGLSNEITEAVKDATEKFVDSNK